jgi:hypothetical protein
MSARRVLSWAAVVLVATAAPACSLDTGAQPTCGGPGEPSVVLIAQSVPSATLVPCVQSVPAGWAFARSQIRDGSTELRLEGGPTASSTVVMDLRASCDPGEAPAVPSRPQELGARVFDAPSSLDPLEGTRYVVFEGGCAVTTYAFDDDVAIAEALAATGAFAYLPRADVVAAVAAADGQILCGAEAPPCGGEDG